MNNRSSHQQLVKFFVKKFIFLALFFQFNIPDQIVQWFYCTCFLHSIIIILSSIAVWRDKMFN